MGNSGSVHHMQSGLKELHNYYQVQPSYKDKAAVSVDDLPSELNSLLLQMPDDKLRKLNPLTATMASGVDNSHHIKVLPSVSGNLRLRSTTNGAILHAEGTIRGRKDSLLSHPTTMVPIIERSRTFISDNSEECMNSNLSSARVLPVMKRRSQTQLDMNIRNRNPNMMVPENVNFKRFSSNLDLRRPSMTNENTEAHSIETFQKLSKVKIKNKKKKAPPVPLSPSEILPITIEQSNEMERRPRLFKTKTQTTANPSRHQIMKKTQSDDDEELSDVVLRSRSDPRFRREKSFDQNLLSSGFVKNRKSLQKDFKPAAIDIAAKRKSLQIEKTTSLLTPVACNRIEKSEFNTKLDGGTKFKTMTKAAQPMSHQRHSFGEGQTVVTPSSRTYRPDSQSKIPQLKKTFYFGMESSKRKDPFTTKNLQIESKESYKSREAKGNSLLKDKDQVYSLNHNHSEVLHDNGIKLSVRPTLPRRQLEIPRFSPITAWRTLSVADERDKDKRSHLTTTSLSPNSSTANAAIVTGYTLAVENRIHRNYRDPCPFYSDNKSGDSGISGDDGYLVEKPIQPQNLEQDQQHLFCELDNIDNNYQAEDLENPPTKVVGPFLTAWTPQQDLEDEEDSSSDGELAVDITDTHTPTSPHIFSLSLPRENQLAGYEANNKMEFRSLQKPKRTTSGDLNIKNGGYNQSTSDSHCNLLHCDVCSNNNFRSDNWVLSKTTGKKTAAFTNLNNNSKSCANRMDSSKIIEENSFFELPVSAQSMSLGSLATGKHVMYLPNRSIANEFTRQSGQIVTRPTSWNLLHKFDTSLEDIVCKNIQLRNKRFSFQSPVRQIERQNLADQLAKEVDQNEALRKSELEAMRRVEEEFQKKRAHEKASIRQQLQLYSMDDDNFMSLPNLSNFRAEPDGAVTNAFELTQELQTSTIRRQNV